MSASVSVCVMLPSAAMIGAAEAPDDTLERAELANVTQGPADKLKRGLANTLLGALEFPHQFFGCRTSGDKLSDALRLGKYPLCVAGGLAGFALREVAGVVEVVTFPLPFPTRDYRWVVPWQLGQMSDYPSLH